MERRLSYSADLCLEVSGGCVLYLQEESPRCFSIALDIAQYCFAEQGLKIVPLLSENLVSASPKSASKAQLGSSLPPARS